MEKGSDLVETETKTDLGLLVENSIKMSAQCAAWVKKRQIPC